MYSESELDQAVAAGVLSREAAAAFRDHVARGRLAPAVDEEHFRLLSGFNDIFVAIAIVALLVGLGWLFGDISPALGGAAVAAASWGLAEYFTRKRRMALPSILLMLSFTGGVAGTLIGVMTELNPDLPDRVDAMIGAGIAAVTAFAAWVHWMRFMVPITVAAGAVAITGVAAALTVALVPESRTWLNAMLFVAGLLVFALAMAWDMSDRERKTRRADVAFWLHLAAAPLIAHPVFQLLGVFNEAMSPVMAGLVLALYVIFAFVALAVDRRALLVSGLIYVLWALYALFHQAGAVELGASLTAVVIGSALLMLSAFWHPMRRGVVSLLGNLQHRLPPVQIAAA